MRTRPAQLSFARLIHWLAPLLAALAMLLATAAAHAQPTEEDEENGRELAGQAMGHYKNDEFEQALDLFKQARAIYPTGQVLRMTGYTLVSMESWLEAAETLEEALNTSYKPLSEDDAEHAKEFLATAMSHIATVEIISSVPEATVTVDSGAEESLPHKMRLVAGSHSFVVTAPEHDAVSDERDVAGGASITIELDPEPTAEPEPEPPPKPPPPKPEPDDGGSAFGWFPGQGAIGLATAGIGLGLVGVGIGTGVYGTNLNTAAQDNIEVHNQTYDPECKNNRELCLHDIALINSDSERANDLMTASTALVISGGAAFVVGLTLFLFSEQSPFAGDGDSAGEASLACGPQVDGSLGGLACVGSF